MGPFPDAEVTIAWMIGSVIMIVGVICIYVIYSWKENPLSRTGYKSTDCIICSDNSCPHCIERATRLKHTLLNRDLLRHEKDCVHRQSLGSEPCDCGVDAL